MMLIAWGLVTLGSAAAWKGGLDVLRQYNRTSEPVPNPYTPAAAFNVFRLRPFMDRAVALLAGMRHSVYRSPQVNKLVGGAQPRPDHPLGSRHMRALAEDIAPGRGMSLDEAMAILYAAAKAGELGPVRQLIKETAKGIVHVSWYGAVEPQLGYIELLEQPTREKTYIPYRMVA